MQAIGHHYYFHADRAMVTAWLATWVLVSSWLNASAGQQPEDLQKDVIKTADGYLHKPSGLEFLPPKNWTVRPSKPVQRCSAFELRCRLPGDSSETIEATLMLIPLEGLTLKEDLEQELQVLRLTYKDKNVLEPTDIEIPTQPRLTGYRILIEEGPDLKGRQSGVLYLFSTANEKKAWKVRLRATWNKAVAKSAFAETEKLLGQFRLHPPN